VDSSISIVFPERSSESFSVVSTIYTIGHSTRSIEDFLKVLKKYEIAVLADVRLIPKSRTNPQFSQEALESSLRNAGIEYRHFMGLGGHRRPVENSPNGGWHNESFRGYADYATTREFQQNLQSLIEIAETHTTAIMCAEFVPWKCHRSIIADYLLVRGLYVIDIFDEKHSRKHVLTNFAKVANRIFLIYPSDTPPLDQSSWSF